MDEKRKEEEARELTPDEIDEMIFSRTDCKWRV